MIDEFHQAERDDHELDRAYDHDLRQADWDDLHGSIEREDIDHGR